MSRIFLILSILLLATHSYSQLSEPEWKTTLYVEDAKGNKDSIIIGYDGSVETKFNPEYGENDLPHVLDSVLDVRVIISKDENSPDGFYDSQYYLSNVGIGGAYTEVTGNWGNCHSYTPRINFGVYAKYRPIKVYWDQSVWQDECHFGSWITSSGLTQTAIGWYNLAIDYACMGGTDHVIWDLPTNNIIPVLAIESDHWLTTLPTMDGRLDTMWILQVAIKRRTFFDTPCRFSSSDDLQWQSLHLYPNPTADVLYIDAIQNINQVKIYSGDGRTEFIQNIHDTQAKIDISMLPTGIKIIELVDDQGKIHREKWIKI